MSFQINGNVIETDNEGYMLDPGDWSMTVAEHIAQQEKMELIDERLEIVHFVRDYYEQRDPVPELRTLLRSLREKHGKETATRRYLYRLFPYGYGQQACKIAGMRKPLKLLLDL